MAPGTNVAEYAALRKSLSSIRALIASFRNSLDSAPTAQPRISDDLDPLSILADASKLLKAQITKLSLLMINKPFAPKEVRFILEALSTSILPALMSTLELCHPVTYSRAFYDHLRATLRLLWRELDSLLERVSENETRAQEIEEKAVLSSTGLIWERCDSMIETGQGGLGKFADSRISEYASLFEDAITELEEWDPDGEESDLSGSDEGDGTHAEAVICTPTTSDEESLGSGLARLSVSPMHELKVPVMKRLRMVKLLYPAIKKRRVRTFSCGETATTPLDQKALIQRMDEIIQHSQQFTIIADDLAAALYEGTPAEVNRKSQDLSREALHCITIARTNWDRNEDEFTPWFDKWKERFEDQFESVKEMS